MFIFAHTDLEGIAVYEDERVLYEGYDAPAVVRPYGPPVDQREAAPVVVECPAWEVVS